MTATLPVVDIICALVILLFALIGLFRGFIASVFNKLAPILAVWAAILFFKPFSEVLSSHIQNQTLCYISAFFIIFVVTFIIIKIIQIVAEKIFSVKLLKQLDRTLGFLFGVIEGLALVILAFFVLRAQSWFDTSALLEGSFFYTQLENLFFAPIEPLIIQKA